MVHAHPDPTLTTALEWNIANLFAMEQDVMICVLDKNGHLGKNRASIILDIFRVNLHPEHSATICNMKFWLQTVTT